jgi:hypothetical protein
MVHRIPANSTNPFYKNAIMAGFAPWITCIFVVYTLSMALRPPPQIIKVVRPSKRSQLTSATERAMLSYATGGPEGLRVF